MKNGVRAQEVSLNLGEERRGFSPSLWGVFCIIISLFSLLHKRGVFHSKYGVIVSLPVYPWLFFCVPSLCIPIPDLGMGDARSFWNPETLFTLPLTRWLSFSDWSKLLEEILISRYSKTDGFMQFWVDALFTRFLYLQNPFLPRQYLAPPPPYPSHRTVTTRLLN